MDNRFIRGLGRIVAEVAGGVGAGGVGAGGATFTLLGGNVTVLAAKTCIENLICSSQIEAAIASVAIGVLAIGVERVIIRTVLNR